MAVSDLDKLSHLLGDLELLKDDKKDVVEVFNSILSTLNDNPEEKCTIDICRCAKEVSSAFGCGILDIEIKAAETTAELCKSDIARPILSNSDAIVPLIQMLSSTTEAQVQACRAIGNICYDNNSGRLCFFDNNGLEEIVGVLKKCTLPDTDPLLRTTAAGCTLNVIFSQDHLYSKVVDMGVMEILCDILTYDIGTKQAEETAIHIYVILGFLTESAPSVLMSEKLCEVTVKVLGASTNGELSELCVELLHSQAEKDEVRLHLAKAGLCELLIELMEKHGRYADDDETRNLLKMACDLIIIILNGDSSMEIAYGSGKGKVFEGLLSWLTSSDIDLQVTAVLAMANFARTDLHCIQMVGLGVSKKLLTLLSQNNTSEAKIRLQHALLSALRNLVIPPQNKSTVLSQGLFGALYPMFSIPTFPVVFKLLGTLRMVIDGQPEAACELGSKDEVVTKLIGWCTTEDHPGVQGEANRLLAWIIKNSRDREVIGKMVSCGVVSSLVGMISAEHTVMQAEAFLSLNLVTAMRGQDAEPYLLKSRIGEVLATFLTNTPPKEVFHNLLALVSQLATSAEMRTHLRETGVPKALYSAILSDSLADLRDQVIRLTTMLDAG